MINEDMFFFPMLLPPSSTSLRRALKLHTSVKMLPHPLSAMEAVSTRRWEYGLTCLPVTQCVFENLVFRYFCIILGMIA